MLVLIANDAAGEGVNLQRGHLMVNYDLPWNPNKIEQRFGRIHRIGQTEVCHLWNIVAADTREGEVYARLLEKLEAAREALGGRVYDVLGELFEGTALKDLLFQAIQYGEQEDVKARLFRQVDGAVDQEHLLELLQRRALTNDTMPEAKVQELRLEMVREQYEQIMRQGAILVDDLDTGTGLSAVFLLEHSIQDGRTTSAGKPHIVSERLQFAAIDKAGRAVNAGIAPHLNLRPATAEEIASVRPFLDEDWLTTELEKTAVQFATVELAQAHIAEVRARRLPEIEKVEHEVRARLKKEINYWDSRAFELKEEEKAGKKTRLSWQNAQRRAEDLAERQKRRMGQLEQERFISSQPPRVRGGMVVIPRGLLDAQAPSGPSQLDGTPQGFATDATARRVIELAAMDAVIATERTLGNVPTDVSAQKIGYDVVSYDPATKHLRFIEVKGRIHGADTVMITRQEVITSLHEPDKYILAVVHVEDGQAGVPRYVRGALSDHEPAFEHTAIQFNLARLMERAEAPR